MTRRLFWKIFIGFWLTFFAMSQITWLAFNLVRPPPEQSEYERGMASMSVTAAVSAISTDGIQAFRQELSTWPRDQRRQLVVQGISEPRITRPTLAETVAVAPNGDRYRVSYRAQNNPRRRGNFDSFFGPWEVVGAAAVSGFVFSAVLAWYLTRPVQQLRIGFGRLAKGNFSTRLGPAVGRRRDEIADLAHDFDRMAVRLEELVTARDRMLADVSHELRTPLARMNIAIDLGRQDPAKLPSSLERIGIEVGKLDQMVGELLTLVKLETGQTAGDDYTSFAEVVSSVVNDARIEAASKDISIRQDVEEVGPGCDWIVRGDGRLISRAVENVLRNAIRYSPEGGTVLVRLRHEDKSFRLYVSDEGPGVSEEAMTGLFKPFAISSDGFGFGLGLSIAQRAVTVHGGAISAQNRRAGGLEMTITLPATNIDSG